MILLVRRPTKVDPKDSDFLTVADLRTRLNLGRTQVLELCQNGVLPAMRFGRQWRVAKPAYERWLNGQGATPPAEPARRGGR